jgi:hypothetical protein
MTETPIELAPPRGARARTAGAWLQLACALAVIVGVFAQVYLIGAYIFGAGSAALDAHRSIGFSVHGIEVLTLVAALAARADIRLSLLLAAVGTVQISLASAHGWTGGLHPLGALIVLATATVLARRALRRTVAARATR